MSLMCQKDSFLREFKSPIVSCQKASVKIDGEETTGFEVVLQDTIFFPEGGGQPCDTGFLGESEVLNVRRNGSQAILFVKDRESSQELEIGREPLQKIDWDRRFDHMQQHSGQHLITAVALKYFNLLTTSWSLGPDICNIELDSANIPVETVVELEKLVNEKIRENLPVTVSYRDKDDLADIRQQMELPDDIDGSLRIVSIESLDKNPCCGTHVPSLCHLQVIKLMGVQKGKKGKSLLSFLAGNRVLNYLENAVQREKLLSATLKCSNEEIVAILDKLQKTVRRWHKNCVSALRDLAKLEAERYLAQEDKPAFFSIHRQEGEYDFISTFFGTIGESDLADRLILLSIADDCIVPDSPGQFVIAGRKDLLEKCGKIATEKFGAKGSIFQGRFRARVQDVSKIIKMEEEFKKVLN